jgi:hypothetical protein
LRAGGRWLLVLVALALARSAALAVLTPPYQSSDEPWHLDYARAVGQGELPVLGRTRMARAIVDDDVRQTSVRRLTLYGIDDPAYSREAFQPPLAYVVPGVVYRLAGRPSGGLVAFRAFDAAAGALLVLLAYAFGRRAFPSRRFAAPMAALVAACLPSVALVASTADNDALAAALALAGLGLAVLVAREGATVARAALLGLVIGLAALTKTSALLLVVPGVLALAIAPLAPGASRRRVLAARVSTMAAVAAALVAPWLARNVVRYGDPLGTSAFSPFHPQPGRRIGGWRLLLGGRPTLTRAARFWPEVGRTSVGVLRWADLYLPPWAYALAAVAALAAVVPLARWLTLRADPADRRALLVVGAALAGYVAGMVWYAFAVDYQPQGRYLVPVLVAAAGVLGAPLGRRGFLLGAACLLALLGAAVATTAATYA